MEEFETIYVDGKKPKYNTNIFVLIDDKMKKKAKKVALKNDTSLSEIIREFLGNYIKENRPKKRTIKSKKSV